MIIFNNAVASDQYSCIFYECGGVDLAIVGRKEFVPSEGENLIHWYLVESLHSPKALTFSHSCILMYRLI